MLLIILSFILVAVILLTIYSSYVKPEPKSNCPTQRPIQVDLCNQCKVMRSHCNCPPKNCEYC